MREISAKKVVHEVGEQIERAEAIVFVKLRVKVQAIAPCAGAGSCEVREMKEEQGAALLLRTLRAVRRLDFVLDSPNDTREPKIQELVPIGLRRVEQDDLAIDGRAADVHDRCGDLPAEASELRHAPSYKGSAALVCERKRTHLSQL